MHRQKLIPYCHSITLYTNEYSTSTLQSRDSLDLEKIYEVQFSVNSPPIRAATIRHYFVAKTFFEHNEYDQKKYS